MPGARDAGGADYGLTEAAVKGERSTNAGKRVAVMNEPEFFYDAAARTILVGNDPRTCDRCGRGPEPTAVIDNSGNQFAALSLCVHCLSELAEVVAKAFPRT